ncbi:hypothetical protein B0H67DRAFT_318539 [Lasiosphaeris hirsuta]|uniref:Uncharacterized protein n=1 Tax=Lasiosphaeris hirsuta TaxID=260670 RepID=A0AA40A1J0_9PEZI|nr:hypothetical protein B0H67DRAFT_318539 [Lasiosphaeris hirsuta]
MASSEATTPERQLSSWGPQNLENGSPYSSRCLTSHGPPHSSLPRWEPALLETPSAKTHSAAWLLDNPTDSQASMNLPQDGMEGWPRLKAKTPRRMSRCVAWPQGAHLSQDSRCFLRSSCASSTISLNHAPPCRLALISAFFYPLVSCSMLILSTTRNGHSVRPAPSNISQHPALRNISSIYQINRFSPPIKHKGSPSTEKDVTFPTSIPRLHNSHLWSYWRRCVLLMFHQHPNADPVLTPPERVSSQPEPSQN